MAVFANQSKNTSTFAKILAHGRDYQIKDIGDKTFEDEIVFADGTTIPVLGDKTFDELSDQAWSNQSKES